MQCILREKLIAQAMKLASVSQVYRTDSLRFVALYFAWLDEAEKDLSGLRAPISVLIQSEKSSLASVADGYLPAQVQAGKSPRKVQAVAAAQSLEKVSKEIYGKIEHIDHVLEQFNEKLCHALAVLASKNPDLYASLQLDQASVDRVWQLLGTTPETIPMYNYFCAKLASADIQYLFFDIIQKVIGNRLASQ